MPVEVLLPKVKVPAYKMPTYVKLAEAFGVGAGTDLFDKSRFRSHGAITGAVWAAGLHGYCLDFDPTIPSYVEIPAAHTQLDFTSEDFSLIARIYIDDLSVAAKDIISEIGNILAGSYCSALANLMSIKLIPEVPILELDAISSIVNKLIKKYSNITDSLVMINTKIKHEVLSVNGIFCFIPSMHTLDTLFKLIKVE